MLYAEASIIKAALQQLDNDGAIVGMTIGRKPPEDDAGGPFRAVGVQVNTSRMTYPQQMVDAIRQFMQARQGEIEKQLADMGVTGVGP